MKLKTHFGNEGRISLMKRKIGSSLGSRIFDVLLYAFLVLLCLLFIYPVWETFVVSFSEADYARSLGLKLWPPRITVDSYRILLSNDLIFTGYKNTIFRTTLGTLVMVVVTFLGGYVLTKRRMPFHSILLIYIMIPMFFQGGLIPTYITIRNLGLLDTLWLFVISGATSTWYLLLTRNYVNQIPSSLVESAMIDGAHPMVIVFKIMLPWCTPLIAVLALYSAVAQWNSWFDALLYCNKRDKLVLALVVRRLVIDTDENLLPGGSLVHATPTHTPETLKAAAIFISILPIMCVYPFLQKYFVKGILVGSIKG